MQSALERTRLAVAALSGLDLLLLFGSRATDQATAHSDWDFAYSANGSFDREALRSTIAEALGIELEDVDLVDLDKASAVLRFEAARDGIVVFGEPSYEQFVLASIHQWFDIQPIVEPAYRELLEALH